MVIMTKIFNSVASMVSNALSRYTNKFVLLWRRTYFKISDLCCKVKEVVSK